MPVRGWLRAVIVVVAAAGLPLRADAGPVPEAMPLERPAPGYRGAGSCSAVACHGSAAASPVGRSVLTNEHTTWAVHDKHASAYQVLFTDRSVDMARRLGLGPAHESGRCLACHSTPAPSDSRVSWSQEGVSCESCHGPADGWLGPHTTAGWRLLSARDKERRFGLFATKELARRVDVCARCHVGEPARGTEPLRDVDHDLIAAGHPALRFEFSAYQALMPPHWVEKGRNRGADFPARAWAVGQVACARAALDLTADRAGRDSWPDFAEYSCFSCHRPIAAAPGSTGAVASSASAPWGTWYHAFPSAVTDSRATGPREPAQSELEALKHFMETGDPKAAEASARASRVARQYAGWLATESEAPSDSANLRRLAADVSGPGRADWDGEAQRYLAAAALRQAFAGLGMDPGGLIPDRAGLLRWRAELQFPANLDRPRFIPPRQGRGGGAGTGRSGNGGP